MSVIKQGLVGSGPVLVLGATKIICFLYLLLLMVVFAKYVTRIIYLLNMGLCPKPRFILLNAQKNGTERKQINVINVFLSFKSPDKELFKCAPVIVSTRAV